MALLVKQPDRTNDAVQTTEVYDLYKRLCERDDSSHLKLRRVRVILSELEFLSIIEQERKWAGKERGITWKTVSLTIHM